MSPAPDHARPWPTYIAAALGSALPVWVVLGGSGEGTVVLGGLAGWAALGLLLHAGVAGAVLLLRRPERRRRRAFALLAVGLGLVLGAVAVEGVLRLAPEGLPRGARRYLEGPSRPFRLSEPRFCVYDGPWGYRGVPGLELPALPTEPELVREGRVRPHPLAEPSEEVAIRYDRSGLRNPPGRDEADLVAVGDSFTFGWNLPREAAWPFRVEEATGRPAYSVAFNAWGPSQALAALRGFGLSRRPAAVVWTFYEGNDLDEEAAWRAWQARGAPRRSAAEVAAAEVPLEGSRLLALGGWLLDGLPPGLYRHPGSPRPAAVAELGGAPVPYAFAPGGAGAGGRPRSGGVAALTVPPSAWRAHPGFASAVGAIDRGRELAEDAGARFACLLIPTKEHVLYPLLPREARLEALRRSGVRADPAAVDAAAVEWADALLDAVRAELEARGVTVIDLRQPLRVAYRSGRPPYFALDSHWNRAGHALAAGRVVEWLEGGR